MGEVSQVICLAYLKRGHNAFSVDCKPCQGPRPDRHIQGDMFVAFHSRKWDRIIVHPTCTYMCNSGALRLYKGGKKINGIDTQRWSKMVQSANEFKTILDLDCAEIVVENPVMHKHAANIIGVKWSQTIQPYEYGHPESKRTCLWIKGLPLLKPTDILQLPECGYWDNQTPSGQNKLPPSTERGAIRAITYTGWAEAMATQWDRVEDI